MYYDVFQTNFGWVGIIGDTKTIHKITLPVPDKISCEIECINSNQSLKHKPNYLRNLQQDLIRYYQGEKISFANILLDLINTKDFPKNVLTICRSIPYGEVRTYKWIAKTMGNPKLARPIGNVLSTNNHPIVIPCHRVIRSDGNIGGFAGKIHPKSLKHYLLKLEGNNL